MPARLAPRPGAASVVPGAVAARARRSIAARRSIGARLRRQCRHDGLERLLRSDELESLGLAPRVAIGEHVQDRDAFEVDVGFDLHDIADLRS